MLRFGGCLSKAGNLTTSLGSLWNIFNKRHQETGRETKSSEWQWQLKRKNEWVWEFLMNPCIKRSYAKASFNTNYGQRYENVITSVHKITKDMGSGGSTLTRFSIMGSKTDVISQKCYKWATGSHHVPDRRGPRNYLRKIDTTLLREQDHSFSKLIIRII